MIDLAVHQSIFVNEVRRRVFFALPHTQESKYQIDHVIDNSGDMPLEDMFRMAAEYRGGFNQEITARILSRIYKKLGFESAVLRLGHQESGFTHPVTLVVFQLDGKKVVSVQDAYYNFTVEDGIDCLADYFDVVSALNRGGESLFHLSNKQEMKQYLETSKSGMKCIRTQPWYWGDPSWKRWLNAKFGSDSLVNALRLPLELIEFQGNNTVSSIFRDHGYSSISITEENGVYSPSDGVDIFSGIKSGLENLLGTNSSFATLRLAHLRSLPFESKIEMARDFSYLTQSDAKREFHNFFCDNPKLQPTRFIAIGALSADKQDELARELSTYPKESLNEAFGDDPWLHNYMLNWWEYANGLSILESMPWNVSLPIADICNARCSFCTSWFEGKELVRLEQIDAFEPVIRMAHQFGLAGHGEPLIHPKIKEILKRLAVYLDPRATSYLITNGIHLKENINELLAARVKEFNISLNAADPVVHEDVMGLGPDGFDKVVSGIKALIASSKESGSDCKVNISLVITAQNVHQLSDFIRLGAELGVNCVMLKTLAGQSGLPLGLNYHTLPPYLDKDFDHHVNGAIETIERFKSIVDIKADPTSWGTPIFPPDLERTIRHSPPPAIARPNVSANKEVRNFYRDQDKFKSVTKGKVNLTRTSSDEEDTSNPYNRTPPFDCRAPYQFLYINDFSNSMVPCCYMSHVPLHDDVIFDGSYDFNEAWNSQAMIELRRRLNKGPLYPMCKRCPRVY